MSLAVLADHMASKGRGPDSMLVHMSPRELQGLQALAMKHGGSLTINPETGLPEAGFLDKLLPAIIGFALAPMTAGTSLAFLGATPFASAMTVGALQTLRTGDLGKGIMAGFGAYGGAGLQAGLAGAGASTLAGEGIATEAAKNAALEGVTLPADYAELAARTATPDQIAAAKAAASPMDLLSTGAKSATASPEAMAGFAKDNFKPLMYAAGPILADQAVKSNMPTTTTRPGAVRTYSYNPYDQLYTPTGNYEVPVKAAEGGLMGMNDGGYSPGQLNFAQRSEPVVRMAAGGTAPISAADAQKLVEAQYATIGRSGTGAGTNQIDEAGLKAWTEDLTSGRVSANDFGNRFQTAVKDYMAQRPEDQYTQYVKEFQANQANTGGGGGNAAITGGLDNLAAANNITNVTGGGGNGATAVTANNAATNLAAFSNDYTGANINDYIANNKLDAAGITAAAKQFNVDPAQITAAQNAQNIVTNVYRNVLGRDPDPAGLSWWTNQIMNGDRTGQEMYTEFKKSAQDILNATGTKGIGNFNMSLDEAAKDYTGYQSADKRTIADEWVRNTLGREVTDADRQTQWYKDAVNSGVMNTIDKAQSIYSGFKDYATGEATTTTAKKIADAKALLAANKLTEADVIRQTGKTIAELVGSGINLESNLFKAAQLRKPGDKPAEFDFSTITKPKTTVASTFDTTNPYGNNTGNALTSTPGDLTRNADGTVTVQPNIPGRPEGGFPGMGAVKDAYTAGGGSLGYIPYAPKTIEEFDAKYNKLTGGSKQAMDYLTGKTKYSATPYTETGEVMKPYSESVLGVPRSLSSKKVLFDPKTKTYKNNPDYIPVSYTDKGEKVYGLSGRDIAAQLPDMPKSDYEKWVRDNNVTHAQIAEALGISLAEAKKRYPLKTTDTASTASTSGSYDGGGGGGGEANGGLMAMAGGGMAGQFDLGGYSDGGRLLRGPGDGVSDSIPATIGNKRPARLADGEFVVPARIVSELGNGSTEAGARKLYAMMDRVQSARRGTVGRGRVAKNSRADKHLPA
jgi:hypothetical protein